MTGLRSGSVFYSESSNGFSSLVISTELSSAVKSFSIGVSSISMFLIVLAQDLAPGSPEPAPQNGHEKRRVLTLP